MKTNAPPIRDSVLAGQIAEKIHALSTMKMPELWALWDQFFARRPPRPNRPYIESRVGYKLQEQAFGGLASSTRDMLAEYGARFSKIKSTSRAKSVVLPGSTLVREFNGRKHQVIVLTDGTYEYEGQVFKSLSAIAKLITCTQWSGPAFFGLRGKKA